jgi:hypothetical protein
MSRSILTTLIQDFKTFNGTGNLNRANDKLAEILSMIVDLLLPEPEATVASAAVDAATTLATNKAAATEVKTEVVSGAKTLGSTLLGGAISVIEKEGAAVASEISSTLKTASPVATATTPAAVAPVVDPAAATVAPSATEVAAPAAQAADATPAADVASTDPTADASTSKKGGRPKSKS